MENSPGGAQRDCLTRTFVLWRWLFACALTTTLALADGMIIGYDPRLGRWSLQQEESQLCLINYEHAVEKMLVSVALSNLRGAKAAWVIPIPSPPDSAAIDIVKGFPPLAGTNVLERSNRVVDETFTWMSYTQLYPILFLRGLERESEFGVDAGYYGEFRDVSVYEHREAMGLTAEVVTAQHPGAIVGYLAEKGVELPDNARQVLDTYRQDSFSFVVTWISDSSAFMRESMDGLRRQDLTPAIGISVAFPTRRAYFPLRPTSVYGRAEVPIDLYFIGHRMPTTYRKADPVEATAYVSYYTQEDYLVPAALRTFFNGKDHVRRLDYTHIEIRTQSSRLKKDLWFGAGPPFDVAFARLLNDCQLIWVPLIFLLCSCAASLIAWAMTLKRFRFRFLRQAGFGLWNCLGLVGILMAVSSPEILPPNAGSGRRASFVVLFTVLFQALLAAFYLAVKAIIRVG